MDDPLQHVPTWIRLAIGLSAIGIFLLFEWILSGRFRVKKEEEDFERQLDIPWESRFTSADNEIKNVINSLPSEIRSEAEKIAFLLEKWPPEDKSRFETMGSYQGFEPGKISRQGGVIYIFIGPHHYFCERERIDFEKEIRRTYLHELGHHFGLDEGELEERHL